MQKEQVVAAFGEGLASLLVGPEGGLVQQKCVEPAFGVAGSLQVVQ